MNHAMTIVRLLFVLFGLYLAAAPAFSARPNVLLIAIDDLNDWVTPLGGHRLVKTPNFDRLAARGTTFANAHCQAPLCNPSRTSMLTGLRPSTSGVYALDPWFRTVEPLRDVVTLPQHFMANGYNVVTCGKIFHDAYPPIKQRTNATEFSEWGPHGGSGKLKPAKKFVDTPSKMAAVDWGIFPERDEDCYDYDLATWATNRLRSLSGETPFMLCVGFRHPHVPCFAPKKWFDLYPDDDSVLPAIQRDDRSDVPSFAWYLHWQLPEPRLAWLEKAGQWRNLVRSYLASISFMDAQVGRVLDALDASPAAANTIVVLWSDHGWHLGEKGISGKNTLWERSTHVPLIFAGPGVAKGVSCARPAELLDIYPTLAEVCGLPARQGLEGHSLARQLRDAKATREFPAITSHGQNNHTIRTEQWRYIRYADGSEELYDMARDPNEWTNLAKDARHAATKRDLARWLPKVNTSPAPGGVTRLVEIKDGVVWWEGRAIEKGAPVPE